MSSVRAIDTQIALDFSDRYITVRWGRRKTPCPIVPVPCDFQLRMLRVANDLGVKTASPCDAQCITEITFHRDDLFFSITNNL